MRTSWLLVVLLTACPGNKTATAPANVLSDIKRALAERDKRLSRYLVEATSKQGEAVATHTFVYRAPNRVKGTLLTPQAVTLAFDGTRFFKLSPAEKKLEAFEVKLPQEKAALFLTTQFAPFVPEGYRTPLLPSKGVTATFTAARGGDTVELIIEPSDGTDTVTVTYVLRAVSGDFVSKKTAANGHVSEVIVEEQHCDIALALCVPKVVVQKDDGVEVARTTFTRIDLAPDVPNDAFTLGAPEGFAVEKHELVDATAQ